MAKIFGAHEKGPNTNWTAFTVTITGSTSNPTKGTVATDAAFWRRVGDSMEIVYSYRQTGAGASGSGTYLFSIPGGHTIDTTKTTSSAGNQGRASVGAAHSSDGTNNYTGYVQVHNTTNLNVVTDNGTNGATAIVSNTNSPLGNASAQYSFLAKVPIVGWDANDILRVSDDSTI